MGKQSTVALASEGLKEALGALDHLARLDAQRVLRAEFKTLAELANTYARAGATTRMEQVAARTLKPSGSATSAALRYGEGVPFAMGTEFGAGRNQHRIKLGGRSATRRYSSHTAKGWMYGWNQFRDWRGSDEDAGYFVWPGIRRAVVDRLDGFADALARLFETGKEPG